MHITSHHIKLFIIQQYEIQRTLTNTLKILWDKYAIHHTILKSNTFLHHTILHYTIIWITLLCNAILHDNMQDCTAFQILFYEDSRISSVQIWFLLKCPILYFHHLRSMVVYQFHYFSDSIASFHRNARDTLFDICLMSFVVV